MNADGSSEAAGSGSSSDWMVWISPDRPPEAMLHTPLRNRTVCTVSVHNEITCYFNTILYTLQTQRSDKTKWLINMNGNGLSKGTIYFLFSLPSFSRFALRGVQKRDLPNTLMNWHLKSPCGGILACDCCSSMMKIINRISETCQKNDKNQKVLI